MQHGEVVESGDCRSYLAERIASINVIKIKIPMYQGQRRHVIKHSEGECLRLASWKQFLHDFLRKYCKREKKNNL